jgi:hypothetical protein
MNSPLSRATPRPHQRKRRHSTVNLNSVRIKELMRLMRTRYRGEAMPEHPAARCLATVICHHLARLPGDQRPRLKDFLACSAPWFGYEQTLDLFADVMSRPKLWKADKLAWMLGLYEKERANLGITTIGACDLSAAERRKARKVRNRAAKEAKRREKGALRRAQYLARSIAKQTPWLAAKCSRATWYRRLKG